MSLFRRSLCTFLLAVALVSLTGQSRARAEFLDWWPAPGCAKIIVENEGPFLSQWAIGPGAGNQPVYKWSDTDGWVWQFAYAWRIAMPKGQSGGNPWVAEISGKIWAWTGTTWIEKPGCARELAFDRDRETVWAIGCTLVGSSDFSIHRLRPGSSTWERMPQSGTSIGRANDMMFMTNSAGKFFTWSESSRRFIERALPSGFNRAEVRGSSNVILRNTNTGRRELWSWGVPGWAFISPNTPNANVIWATRNYAVNGNCEIFWRYHNDAS